MTKSATGLGLALLLSACSGDQTIRRTAPTAPTPPTGFTLSGLVNDSASGRPISGVQLEIWPEPAPTKTPGWSPAFGSTDATGRYNISNWSDWTGTAWVQASKDGYAQQCVARATIKSDTTLNIALAPISNLPVEPSRTTTATTGSRTISGVVYEVTSQGSRPVENGNVGWEHFFDFIVATTRSDAGGRYLLCGLPAGRIDGFFAVKDGYNVTYAAIDSGADTIDIEMKPR